MDSHKTSQTALAQGMVDEVLDVVYKYHGAVPMVLVLGVLEVLENSRVFVTTREKIKHPEGTEWYDATIATLKERLHPSTQKEHRDIAQQVLTTLRTVAPVTMDAFFGDT